MAAFGMVVLGATCLSAAAAPAPSGNALLDVTQHYRPAWLPDGVVEWFREAVADHQSRVRRWRSPGAENTQTVSFEESTDLAMSQPVPGSVDTRPVDVNGSSATLVSPRAFFEGKRASSVEWIAPGGQKLTVDVYGPGDQSALALRIARSTVRVDLPLFNDPIQPGWLPQNGYMTRLEVTGTSPRDWTLVVHTDYPGRDVPQPQPEIVLWARCPDPDVPDGKDRIFAVTVRGKPSRLIAPPIFVKWTVDTLRVPLDDGQCLDVLTSTTSQADMIHIANAVRLTPVDHRWLGTSH
jgi:hypothetical protein